MKKNSSGSLMSAVVFFTLLVVFSVSFFYIVLPALSVQSEGFWILAFTVLGFSYLLYMIFSEEFADIVTFVWDWGIVCCVLALIFGEIFSLELFRADSYHNLTKIEEKKFSAEFEEISKNPSKHFVLDLDSSIRLADQVIGTIDHPEWFGIDHEFNLISYKGRYYRISPLVYDNSFFKYLKAKNSGIPGYILIDAETQKASFVKTQNPIRYSPSAYFSFNLERHLRFQFPTYIFKKSFLEIDEEGTPYYVTGVVKPQIGLFGGHKVLSFILTNACNGISKEYKVENAPKWIDHIFTLDYLQKMAFYYYEYVNGYFNLSKTGINRTSYYYRDRNFYGYNSIVLKNGEIAFVSGVTPANASEVNKGFVSMNCRTGQITYYEAPGSEESRVQSSAQAIYQNYGYKATFPTVVNVTGIPTYLLALKNNAGLIQKFALVRVSDYNVVGTGSSIEEAIGSYRQAIGNKADSSNKHGENGKITIKIEHKYSQILDGTTHYYYVAKGKIYKASAMVNETQFLLQVGDKVTITFIDFADYAIVKSITK